MEEKAVAGAPRVVQGHDFLVTLSDPVTLHCVGWRNDEQEARIYFYAADYSLHRNTIYRSILVRYKSYFSIIAWHPSALFQVLTPNWHVYMRDINLFLLCRGLSIHHNTNMFIQRWYEYEHVTFALSAELYNIPQAYLSWAGKGAQQHNVPLSVCMRFN